MVCVSIWMKPSKSMKREHNTYFNFGSCAKWNSEPSQEHEHPLNSSESYLFGSDTAWTVDLSGLKVHIKGGFRNGAVWFELIEDIKEAVFPPLSSWAEWRNLYSFATADGGRWSKISSAIPVFKEYWLPLKPFLPLSMLKVIRLPLYGMRTIFTAVRQEMSCGLNQWFCVSLALWVASLEFGEQVVHETVGSWSRYWLQGNLYDRRIPMDRYDFLSAMRMVGSERCKISMCWLRGLSHC